MAAPLAPQIHAAILRGATVLTPSQRAAHTLRRAFEAQQAQLGERVWQAPAIHALDTWLVSLWHTLVLEGHESRALLNRSQEQALWQDILLADAEARALARTLAESAARAWRLLHLHNGSGQPGNYPTGTDARAFSRWSQAFERRLARAGFVTAAELPASLAEACAQGTLDLPNAGLALVDFGPLPPATGQLLTHIEQAGFSIERLATTLAQPAASLYAAPHDEAELEAAATWARDLLAHNPQARIALVTADQQRRRPAIERALAALASPESQSLLNAAPPSYEFSLGTPLARAAPVEAAFALLLWPSAPLPLTTLSRLLVSPFLGAKRGGTAPETLAAARFDNDVLGNLKTLRPELPLDACLALLARESRRQPALGELHAHLEALAQAAANYHLTGAQPDLTHPSAEWAHAFRATLEAAGWTLAATAGSLPFQTHRRWESLLDEFAALDLLSLNFTAPEALATLQQLAADAIFAPESHDAPIQVLGPLELGGAPFDALWFLSADDLSWPPAAPTAPLLSFALQRHLHMPGADPVRDQAAAAALTRAVLTAAPQVVVGYAQRHDEGERRLASLIAAFHLPSFAFTPQAPPPALAFESFADTLPLPQTPDILYPGGSSILQLQAACGFRAFAEKRLWSSAPPAAAEPREPGLDPRDRGEIVHKVMEHFWRITATQQALRALPLQAREARLDDSIDLALNDARRLAESPWDDAYLTVQRQRLRDLLLPWLELELTRPDFAVRDAETELIAAIGPLRLKLRVDRIDETAAGPLILDYKTGAASPGQWLTDRPEAPQLPLYAALLAQRNEAPAGAAFALLRPGETLCLKGYATEAGVLEKPSRMPALSFDEQVQDWQRVLTRLAERFVQGDAAVLPRDYPGTCKYCSQRILCRLDPAKLDEPDDEQQPGSLDA